jgi:uncharacterized protein (DUF58 family)
MSAASAARRTASGPPGARPLPINPPIAAPEQALAQMLRTLELTITRKLDGLLHGQYQGLTPGHGSEAGEARTYIPGDDVRRIDWSVTARTRELHVRDLIADRDLEAWLGVDASASMAFGTDKSEKRNVALGAAAAVGFLTARGQNRIGAVIGAGPQRRAFPPRGGRDHLRGMLTALGTISAPDGAGRTDLGALANDIAGRARRRGFVCLISDFMTPPDTWQPAIGLLAMRHDVLAIEIVDQREVDLPAIGSMTLRDPATGDIRDVHITAAVRRRYAAAAEAQREAIRAAIRSTGAHHLQLRTDGDWLVTLMQYVHRQRRQPNVPNVRAGRR